MSNEELVALLRTENKMHRLELVAQLSAALPASVDAVLAGLGDPSPYVRAACAAVLDDAAQDERIEGALRRACRDHDARVRDSALHSLSCAHCKPDGCVTGDSLALLVDALLHDPSIRLRRKMAGGMMHSQAGRSPLVVAAFERILAEETDKVLRHRAAHFLASGEIRRSDMSYRDWLAAWRARIAELEAVAS